MDNLDPATDNQDPNAQTGDTGDTGTATMTPEPSWRDGLESDIKEHPSLANFKTPADLAKSYVNAQKLIGKDKIAMPSEGAEFGNEEYQAVFDRLGRPKEANDYGIPQMEIPEGAPKASDDELTAFKGFAHKIGLLPQQVEALYKFNQENLNNAYANMQQQVNTEYEAAETALRKELGKSYEPMMQRAQSLIQKFGGEKVAAVIGQTGVGRNPEFIKFMINVAKNFGEDGELLGDPQGSSIMSPDEAMKEIKKIKGDKNHPWHNAEHPEHSDAMQYMTSLFEMAYPEEQK